MPSSSVFFVRALYDFDSVTPSSLSFRKNDLIQVLTQLESGWWDGLCNGQRGWFPSNYVTTMEDEEAIEVDDSEDEEEEEEEIEVDDSEDEEEEEEDEEEEEEEEEKIEKEVKVPKAEDEVIILYL